MNYMLNFAYPEELNRYPYEDCGRNDLKAKLRSKLAKLLEEKYEIAVDSFTIRFKGRADDDHGPNSDWVKIKLISSNADDIKLKRFCDDVLNGSNEASDLFASAYTPQDSLEVREYFIEKL